MTLGLVAMMSRLLRSEISACDWVVDREADGSKQLHETVARCGSTHTGEPSDTEFSKSRLGGHAD